MTLTTPTTTASADAAGSGYRAERVPRLGVPGEVRGERVVHELDGIRRPVNPDRLTEVGAQLWQAWTGSAPDQPVPDLLLGLDAGGIPPAFALAAAAGLPYQLAWKLNLNLPGKLVFSEPHARRTDVYLYADVEGRTVLLVDDEVTTGRTLTNLTHVLRGAGARVLGAVCLVEDRTGGGRALLAQHDVPLCALTTLD